MGIRAAELKIETIREKHKSRLPVCQRKLVVQGSQGSLGFGVTTSGQLGYRGDEASNKE